MRAGMGSKKTERYPAAIQVLRSGFYKAAHIMAPEGESAHSEGKAAAQGFCHGRIVCRAVTAPVYREFLASCCCTSCKQNCLVLAFYFF